VEVADLADEATLRPVVRKARVVITTAGPFEKYGQLLVRLCAEEGTHYCDIAGETDFLRKMIAEYDEIAQRSGARIVIHCGNDCIPWDLSLLEMHKLAKGEGQELVAASTFGEFAPQTAASGGTLTTAVFQLGKKRGGEKTSFDPLLRTREGTKSEHITKVTSPKKDVWCSGFSQYGGPWIMGPVMANCVRRSNALLGYSKSFVYSDVMLRGHPSWGQWASEKAYEGLVAAAIMMPSVFARFLPPPGNGPSREAMEAGWLTLHTTGKMVDSSGKETGLKSTYHWPQDTGYLMTASMLVEAGLMHLETQGPGGVLTPAVAFGSPLVPRLEERLGAKFELGVVEETVVPSKM